MLFLFPSPLAFPPRALQLQQVMTLYTDYTAKGHKLKFTRTTPPGSQVTWKFFSISCCLYTLPAGPPLSQKSLTLIKWKDEHGCKREFRLIDRVPDKWKKFGSLLNLTHCQLTCWETQHLRDPVHCWKEVMQCWLDGVSKTYPPSWEGLYGLVEDVGYPAVAIELKKAVENFCEF